MTHKHETERLNRLLSWETDPPPPRPRPPLPAAQTRIEFPSWLEESDLSEALERADDPGGTALPPGWVDRPRPVARPQHTPQPPRTLVRRPAEPAPAPAPAPKVAIRLLIRRRGAEIGRRSFVATTIAIGRGTACTLRLDDKTVSRLHARIVRRGSAWILEDADSCNGVKVNGRLTERMHLRPHDVIAIGEHELHVLPGSPAEEPPPALIESDDGDSDDDHASADPCLQTVFGRTARWKKRDLIDADLAERSINARAYLRVDSAADRLWPKTCQVVLERDVFVIGGGEEADLRVLACWVPRISAVIVRGPSGYSLAPVSYWSAAVRLNGQPVWRTEALEPNDVITVAGQSLTFLLGMPR